MRTVTRILVSLATPAGCPVLCCASALFAGRSKGRGSCSSIVGQPQLSPSPPFVERRRKKRGLAPPKNGAPCGCSSGYQGRRPWLVCAALEVQQELLHRIRSETRLLGGQGRACNGEADDGDNYRSTNGEGRHSFLLVGASRPNDVTRTLPPSTRLTQEAAGRPDSTGNCTQEEYKCAGPQRTARAWRARGLRRGLYSPAGLSYTPLRTHPD